ncbi:UDP-N-acetyl-D-mannosamine dehydrogenase [Brevundimonas sp. BR2-1]|uniref:UDP-N-acetyl-D-mannosamine dehydrogenase n=1 Tax=Brevundimonas sp. BR2-1 TaxID=3031123 RepID=UPI0030AEECBF
MVGLGYIGLPTAAIFADTGLQVIGVDVSSTAVSTINSGRAHITEPDLDLLVRRVVTKGGLCATLTPEPADAFILAVPTPFKADHEPDVSFIEAACESIAPFLQAGNLVVLESTSPVGTTEKVSEWLARARPDLTFPHDRGEASDIRVAHCPERVLPGQILREVVHNARVIGGVTGKCAQAAMTLYKIFVQGDCHLTTARTAELAKLTENAYRDVNIAFANELSVICDGQGVNVWDLIRVANLHPRVSILQPGPGVGGHCIAVDPWFIVAADPVNSRLIRTAREVNNAKPDWVVSKVRDAAAQVDSPVVACLGLAYKPDIDDLRESPSVEIVRKLAVSGDVEILPVEPHVEVLPRELAASGLKLHDLDQALDRANIVLLLVDHASFRSVDRSRLDGKIIIDTRGIW